VSSRLTRARRVLTTALAAVVVAGTVFAYMGGPSAAKLRAAARGRVGSGERGGGDAVAPTVRMRDVGDQPAEGATSAPWTEPRRRYVPAGRLAIPALGIETPFYMGIHPSVVDLGPGLWPGTVLPGRRGNAVFAGHRTTHSHPFEDLDLLHPGDIVRTRSRGGRRVTFRVVGITVVAEEEYEEFVLQEPAHAEARLITLFACAPKGYRTHRIVVRARARAVDNNWIRGDGGGGGLSPSANAG
jgi:LPXTG-site transpeptidase (sortase) family protein